MNRLKPAIRNVLAPRSAVRKKGVQFGNPGAIRENQAIRVNLRIDSHESGHLSSLPLDRNSLYRDSHLDAFFLGKSGSKSAQIVKYYGGSKTLRFPVR